MCGPDSIAPSQNPVSLNLGTVRAVTALNK